jgi:hypothetical protein
MCPETSNLWVIAERILYMHGGAQEHFSSAVWHGLNGTYHDRWIGRGGSTAWPPRSPHFNPLNFYLWGHPKTLMLAAPVDNEEVLHHRIVMPVRLSATTQVSLNGCGGPWWDVSRRALNLMEDNLSTSYKCTPSAITHKLNISGHMLIWTLLSLLSLFWKNKSRMMRSPCCLCVCVSTPHQLSNAWTDLYVTWYAYNGTWAHLNGVTHKSLPSVIPTLQPLKFETKP